MKKIIILSLAFLILGTILGTKIYSATASLEKAFSEGTTYYFIQEGVYSSEDIMQENTENINIKLIDYQDGKYYVYLAITKDVNNAKKIKDIYTNQGYNIYIRERKLTNEEFSSNVTQFDLLINNTSNTEEILTITEVVLANYEEIIKKQ